MDHFGGRLQRPRPRYRPNCLATVGIMLLALGLLMIVWGVTTMHGELKVAKNPLMITGIVFFGCGFVIVFTVSVYQQLYNTEAQTSRNAWSSTPPAYSFEVQVEDPPPNYTECFVIGTSQQGEGEPPPLEDLKTVNDLPTYHDIFGAKKGAKVEEK